MDDQKKNSVIRMGDKEIEIVYKDKEEKEEDTSLDINPIGADEVAEYISPGKYRVVYERGEEP
jgi:hypothetical protein